MNILILGAGQVGSSLAIGLAQENHEITLVDIQEELLTEIRNRVDLRTVLGNGAHPEVLEQAGAADAEMLVAITSSDEVNMVACQMAATRFDIAQCIARVRATEYLVLKDPPLTEMLPIEVPISPELIVSDNIERLIRQPGALQVIDLADGLVRLVAVRISPGAEAAGRNVSELYQSLPDVKLHIAALYRNRRAMKPKPDTRLKALDEVFVLAPPKDIESVMEKLHSEIPTRNHNILIAGGGNIGKILASKLQTDHNVKLIEKDASQAQMLSEQLGDTLVLHGDATDETLLTDENIEEMDIFCAITNSDEANILSAMQAKRMNTGTVIALINRLSYIDLVEESLDIAVSPQQATLSELLREIRRGDVLSAHSLRRGTAEVLETNAHETAAIIGKAINELDLPASADIGALVRDGELLIPDDTMTIQPNDRVILFLSDKDTIRHVERLFQVGATFF